MTIRKMMMTALALMAVAAVAFPLTSALAAHGGALTSGDFDGRAEVVNDATNRRIVGDPNGSGEAHVFSTGGGVVCYVLQVEGIEPATAAHIHAGEAGVSGPVVVPLSPPTDGDSAGCIDTGDAELAADITLNAPELYYVNVHNETYPGGAVRAQLGN